MFWIKVAIGFCALCSVMAWLYGVRLTPSEFASGAVVALILGGVWGYERHRRP